MEPPVLDDLHKPILSLFRFDANLGYAPVFHTLELTEGGAATETVAARGNAVVIEEITPKPFTLLWFLPYRDSITLKRS